MNLAKHKQFMVLILQDIYSDLELANLLGFKGGTAGMFFYGLPRFSVDLDFNLIGSEREKKSKEQLVFVKLKKILLNYGEIDDEAIKRFGSILVLNYESGSRNLKVEVSNRNQNYDHYEIKNFMGINMRVMSLEDMVSHKICALLDRTEITHRDIFDSWYFLKNRTPLNKEIVEERMKMPFSEYMQKCITVLSAFEGQKLLNGIGELVTEEQKAFVKNHLQRELITSLRLYKEFPIFSDLRQGT